jgi:hypothetical protein
MTPVVFDVPYPSRFERGQVVLRIVILFLAAMIGIPFGWILYLGFPVLAALLISQKDGTRYVRDDGPRVTRWLRWIVCAIAYMSLLTDRLPGSGDETVRFDVDRSGTPTVGSALLRIVKAIPSALVLALLTFVSSVVWVVAAVWILVNETYPASLFGYQRGVVRWTARLLAYLASLVEPYPPFKLSTGSTD